MTTFMSDVTATMEVWGDKIPLEELTLTISPLMSIIGSVMRVSNSYQ